MEQKKPLQTYAFLSWLLCQDFAVPPGASKRPTMDTVHTLPPLVSGKTSPEKRSWCGMLMAAML